ncbi:DNA gyrase subunit A [Candidatus Zinderia endosymbiont of Aphrophora alni]|uniref:DNA gyrase subunit A n=1 Tax=Candidatus Zinderia endosymbiont of Aphrophora alni TaxID=3077951 RepID=UPI0030D57A1D
MNKYLKKILDISLEKEMKKNYLNYAMSVIIGRALPDVRDGLKPVHRRILYAMYKINNIYKKPFIKCARIVGEVMGKFHPHGDNSIYEALVRMTQNFSLRYTLIEGQGNFGSIDGDNAAAMRYTECRLKKISNEILKDIEKNTVDFISNYDGKEKEPIILPSKIPNLLINGSSGIAVGLATNIPPHNILEVINATIFLLKNKNCTIKELIKFIPAPDLPTGGIIYGLSGIKKAYKTGKGKMIIKGKVHFEKYNNNLNTAIIIDEIPFLVNKKTLIEKIIELVHKKKIEGINNIKDESNKLGIRIVIELKDNKSPKTILNILYKYTQLQETFGINFVALVKKKPKLLNLKQILEYFLLHRKEIIIRKTKFQIKKIKKKKHLLKGLAIAIDNINKFIKIITSLKNLKDIKKKLLKKVWFSKIIEKIKKNNKNNKNITLKLTNKQIEKILQIKLQNLTKIEKKKIFKQYKKIEKKIIIYNKILFDKNTLKEIIFKELTKIKENFILNKEKRLSIIETQTIELIKEDFIFLENIIITLSFLGNIKYQPISNYKLQKKGGKGKKIITNLKNDWIIQLLTTNTHDYLLCFTNKGKLYLLKIWEITQNNENNENKLINNFFKLKKNEKITAIFALSKENKTFPQNKYIFMATNLGKVKRTPLSNFINIRKNGIIAIELDKNDFLINIVLTNGNNDIMLFSSSGKSIKFKESDIKLTGRFTKGINGMNLKKNQTIIALLVIKNDNQNILTVTENGFGKKTSVKEYTKHKKGTKGIITMKINKKNGKIIGAIPVKEKDEIILITNKAITIRIKVSEIPIMKRFTQGIKLISLKENNKLCGIQKIFK